MHNFLSVRERGGFSLPSYMMEGSFLTCHVQQYVMWLGERSVSQTNSLSCCIILREIRRCHRGELSPLSKRNWGEGFLSLFLPLDAFVEPLPKIFFEGRIFIAVEREGKTFLRSPIERFPPKYRADKRFFFFLKDI